MLFDNRDSVAVLLFNDYYKCKTLSIKNEHVSAIVFGFLWAANIEAMLMTIDREGSVRVIHDNRSLMITW